MRFAAAIVVLFLLASSTGAARRRGGPGDWGPEGLKSTAKTAFSAMSAGNLAEAARLFDEGRIRSAEQGFDRAALRFTISAASCRFAAGSYKAAAALYLDAERDAKRLGDLEALTLIRGNLASLYFEFQDRDAAIRVAEAAIRDLGRSKAQAGTELLLLLANFYSASGRYDDSAPLYEKALESAMSQKSAQAEALAWDEYGADRLRAGDYAAAEHHLLQAFRMRRLLVRPELSASYDNLSEYYRRRGDFRRALLFADRALESEPIPSIPPHWHYRLRGEARAQLGDDVGALNDFYSALRFAEVWRGEVLPADVLRSSSNAAIQQVCDDFVNTAERLNAATGRVEYARAAWEAVEQNRAASLREMIASAWRDRVSASYWATLAGFRTALIRAVRAGENSPEAQQVGELQLQLLQMETKAGLDSNLPLRSAGDTPQVLSPHFSENSPPHDSLSLVQKRLGRRAFISFRLGASVSYRWVVTERGFAVDRLPSRAELDKAVDGFEKAVRSGDTEAIEMGARLFETMFGGLPPSARQAGTWLLAPDEALYRVPFSALVPELRGQQPVFLAELHALEIVPGAWAIGDRHATGGSFVALADAIYNRADSRAGGSRMTFRLPFVRPEPSVEFPRIPASAAEARTCSREYGSPNTMLMLGPDASRDGLQRALASNPAVLHLATHVLAENTGEEPLILLSSPRPGHPDPLTVREVAAMRVPGSVVVMSGCSSVRGRTMAGAGLFGLSRAWLAAGARGVVASHWPVPDDNNALFRRFYKHLGQTPEQAPSPAEALRQARVDLIRAGGPAASPRYWAAYEYIGRSN